MSAILDRAGLAASPCAGVTLADLNRIIAELVDEDEDAAGAQATDLAAIRETLLALQKEEDQLYAWLERLQALKPPLPEGARLYPDVSQHARFGAELDYPRPRAGRSRAIAQHFFGQRAYAFLLSVDGLPPWINELVRKAHDTSSC